MLMPNRLVPNCRAISGSWRGPGPAFKPSRTNLESDSCAEEYWPFGRRAQVAGAPGSGAPASAPRIHLIEPSWRRALRAMPTACPMRLRRPHDAVAFEPCRDLPRRSGLCSGASIRRESMAFNLPRGGNLGHGRNRAPARPQRRIHAPRSVAAQETFVNAPAAGHRVAGITGGLLTIYPSRRPASPRRARCRRPSLQTIGRCRWRSDCRRRR